MSPPTLAGRPDFAVARDISSHVQESVRVYVNPSRIRLNFDRADNIIAFFDLSQSLGFLFIDRYVSSNFAENDICCAGLGIDFRSM